MRISRLCNIMRFIDFDNVNILWDRLKRGKVCALSYSILGVHKGGAESFDGHSCS